MRDGKGLRGYGIKGLRKTILNAGFLILDWGGDCSRHRGCGTRFRAPRSRRTFRYYAESQNVRERWLGRTQTRRLYAECRNVMGNPVIVLGYVRA